MKKIIPLILVLACTLFIGCASCGPDPLEAPAPEWVDSPAVTAVFSKYGLEGAFVLFDQQANRLVGHNQLRAETRFVPASTFKIPNSLFGFASGVVRDGGDILPYGGGAQPLPAWERDMGLAEAIKVSNVPVYQELARRIGLERMRAFVAALDYGNRDIGEQVDIFWLRGPLKISALEQAGFLARLALGQLPFPAEAQELTRQITLVEKGAGWELHGKTGTAAVYEPALRWWVGWVEKGGRVYSFALNLDMPASADWVEAFEKASGQPLAVAVGRECLAVLDILAGQSYFFAKPLQ